MMATVVTSHKACTVNPLKMSQPIGAALAYLGLDACMPALHGSQGCTAFGMVLFVRHFRENIPLQTTAMNEATTIMGGMDNIEQAIMNIWTRAKPRIIGIASTGLTETKGDDVDGYLRLIRKKHPELNELAIVYVSTPDYLGAFQDGWAKAVVRIVQELVEPATKKNKTQVNVLAGSHLTPGDIEDIRQIIQDFGLDPIILPDLSGSLDGHVPADFKPTTTGGTTLDEIRCMGSSEVTMVIGEHMLPAAVELSMKAEVPYVVFDRLLGLGANDEFMAFLSRTSGKPVPGKYRRQRSQLVDAMLDGHFFFGGKKVAIGAEPDLLWGISSLLVEMGCEIHAAVTTTSSEMLERISTPEVLIGDLEDLEFRAKGCDLLITHSHGRQMAERLDIPFLRVGMPIFDRLGAAHRISVGYKGSRDLIFEIGNMFMSNHAEVGPETWRDTSAQASGH
nr:nitrogenase iron-molybdenum cofactor biosynthesis protein NifN [Ferrovum sp.]